MEMTTIVMLRNVKPTVKKEDVRVCFNYSSDGYDADICVDIQSNRDVYVLCEGHPIDSEERWQVECNWTGAIIQLICVFV